MRGKHNQATPVPPRGGVDSAAISESAQGRFLVDGVEMLGAARKRERVEEPLGDEFGLM